GVYRAVNLPAGVYTATVRLLGYMARTYPGTRITDGGSTTLDVVMTGQIVQLNQTVVTASRNKPEKALDAPAMISVVTTEQIEEKPAVTIADYLRATPGVDVSKGGIAQSNIVTRGFNNAFSGSMLMLQDYRFAGVPSLRVNVPFLMTGTSDDIDRIEVLLGPASALYGPNSGAGVLHVITKSPFNSKGTSVSLDGGERSVMRGGIRHAGTVGTKFGYKLSGEYMRGKDWEFIDQSEPATFAAGVAPAGRVGQANFRNFDLERGTGEARVDIRPTDDLELISTVGMTKMFSGLELTSSNGTAQAKNWSYLNFQQRLRYKRLFAQLFLNNSNAGNDSSNSTTGTYLLRTGQPIVDKSRVFGAQVQHGFDMAAGKQSFTYGADYIWTNPRTGGTINGANEDIDNVTEYGGYVQSSTKPTTRFEVLLAARGDKNNVTEGALFSPRAALIFKPTETSNIRASYNKSFSTPANFSFFLDLLSQQNAGGSGLNVVARGNPPKEGYRFRQGCTGAAIADYCMMSPYVSSGAFTGATASAAFPGLIAGNSAALSAALTPGIVGALQQAGLSQEQATGLAQALVPNLIASLSAARPTEAQLSSRISFLGSPTALTAAALAPVAPLSASLNDTYELGYKGIIRDRFRFDIAAWRQRRGEVASTVALTTPSVFFGNMTQLTSYIAGNVSPVIVQGLQGAVGPANAAGIAALLAPGIGAQLTQRLAPAPLGVVTFDDPRSKANELYAVYRAVPVEIWVSGLDAAVEFVATNRLVFDATFSHANKNVFNNIQGPNGAPFMSNSPRNRGSVGGRFSPGRNGFGGELRVRYTDAYPVNSSVYATNVAFAIAQGRPGAAPNAVTGYNKCNPVGAGAFCYPSIPTAFTLDLQLTKKFEIGSQRAMLSINATNLFDNQVPSFAGVPNIGRLVLTRLQYTF
ncbi:MAG: TonB-dependent receptor, partial [Phycisphaerae bacterium]|nr:TonB-dependent receptor [Gemmatimonadaceae bacterium]